MSSGQLSQANDTPRWQTLWQAAARHRRSMAYLVAAAIILMAAAACTTINVRDSVLDSFQLRLLVAFLSCVAGSNILTALNVRHERWHVVTWTAVIGGWFLLLFLT